MKREIPDIALTLTPGIGPKGAVHLLDVFGSAEAVFSASADELIEKARLRPELARAILQKKAFADAEREVKHCRKHGIEIIASTDAQYPALLRETADYPHVLYVLGSPEALGKTTLTMVGTRRMTPYGQQMADRLIGELADRVADTVIVSGLPSASIRPVTVRRSLSACRPSASSPRPFPASRPHSTRPSPGI